MAKTTQIPFGDIYFVGTPAIENAGRLLYNEEKQRKAQQEAANKALDDEFTKNVAGIRDADVNDLARVYGDYKVAAKSLIKQKDGGTPQQQLDLLRKKAQIYKTINESKAYKQYEDEIGKGIISNSDAYEDNAHQVLIKSRQTPLSQLGDLRNYDYKYKGENINLQELDTKAKGQIRSILGAEKKEGFIYKTPVYKFGNTPAQYYESLLNGIAYTRKGERNAAGILSHLDPNYILAVQEKYKQIPLEEWQKMGLQEPQDLEIKPTDSKAVILAKHKAQLYAINTPITEDKPLIREDKEATINDQQEFELKKLAIQRANQEYLIRLRKRLENETGNVNLFNNIYEEIDNTLASNQDQMIPINKLGSQAQEVILEIGKKLYGDKLISEDGKKKRLPLDQGDLYVKKDENGEIGLYFPEVGQFITKLPFKDVNLKGNKDVKSRRQILAESNKPKSATYNIKGKTYSEKELLDMGYSIDQIAPYKQK